MRLPGRDGRTLFRQPYKQKTLRSFNPFLIVPKSEQGQICDASAGRTVNECRQDAMYKYLGFVRQFFCRLATKHGILVNETYQSVNSQASQRSTARELCVHSNDLLSSLLGLSSPCFSLQK